MNKLFRTQLPTFIPITLKLIDNKVNNQFFAQKST